MTKTLFPGLVFRTEAGVIRARVTTRADRFVDRLLHQRRRVADQERAKRFGALRELPVAIEIVGVIHVATEDLAERLGATIWRTFCPPGSGSSYTAAQVSQVLAFCRKQGLKVHGLQNDVEEERRVFQRPVIEVRTVPDPGVARLELLHQLEQRDEADPSPMPGYKPAGVNMRLLIGSLADMKGLTEEQKRGAQQFRTVAEQAQMGGARAVDYERTKVDTSMLNDVVEIGAAARAQFHDARVCLGLGTQRLAVAERMILHDESIRQVALALGQGKGGMARKRIVAIAKEAATVLARHFHTTTAGSRKPRFAGERPSELSHSFQQEIGDEA